MSLCHSQSKRIGDTIYHLEILDLLEEKRRPLTKTEIVYFLKSRREHVNVCRVGKVLRKMHLHSDKVNRKKEMISIEKHGTNYKIPAFKYYITNDI